MQLTLSQTNFFRAVLIHGLFASNCYCFHCYIQMGINSLGNEAEKNENRVGVEQELGWGNQYFQ